MDGRERIRRAYYVEHKPKRQIARELGYSRDRGQSAGRSRTGHPSLEPAAPGSCAGPGRAGESGGAKHAIGMYDQPRLIYRKVEQTLK